MLRWLARGVLVVLVLLVIAVAALPWLAGPALRVGLQIAGFEDVRFEELRIGLNQAEVSNLHLGSQPGQRVARLQADYRLRDLFAGRLASLEIEGLRLRARLGERGLELAGLPVGEAGNSGPLPALPWPERLVLDDAVVELVAPMATVHLPLEATLEPVGARAQFRLTSDPLTLDGAEGTVAGRLELEGSLPIDQTPRLGTIDAHGRLQVAADHLEADAARGVDASGTIAWTVADGRAVLSTSDLELRVAALPELLAGGARELLPAPWYLRAGSDEDPFRLVLSELSDGYALDVTGMTSLAAEGAEVQAAATGSLLLGEDLALRELDVDNLWLSSEGVDWRDLEVQRATLDLEAQGPFAGLQGSAYLKLEGAGSVSDLTLRGLSLEQGLDFTRSPHRVVLTLQSGGAVRLEELTWRNQLRGGPVSVTPQQSDEAALVIQAEDGQLRGWQHALGAGIEAAELRLADPGSPIELEDATARLQLSLSGDGDGLEQGRLLIEDGGVRIPAQAVTLGGIRSEAAFGESDLAPDQTIPVEIATIRHGAEPPWFSPFRLQANLRPRPEAIAFQGRLGGAGGALSVAFRGSHEPGRDGGRMVLEGEPIRFGPGELQPADLVPALGAALERVSGRLDLDGELMWRGGELQSDLALLLEDVGFTAGPARLQQVEGMVRFDRLEPLATPAGQRLSVGRLDVGLPLSHGFATFQLEPGGPLAVEELRFRFAGGRLRAEPFRVGSDDPGTFVTLEAERLDLAQILEHLEIDGLTGEGTIGGRLPVVIEGGEALIRGGELVSQRPGWLRYRPGQPPAALQADAEGLDLLLQALENFRYEELRITLDGRTDAEMDIQLHIEGANPNLYGGHPVEFNLNLEGELGNILRSSLRGYQVPDRVRRQLKGRQRQ